MWKNTIGPGRSQMTIWWTCIACSIPQATNALLEYVVLTDLALQQWLHERSSMLDYTYIACLVHDNLPLHKHDTSHLHFKDWFILMRNKPDCHIEPWGTWS